MASIREMNGKWIVNIRKKGLRQINKTFKTKKEAELYATQVENSISSGMNNDTLPFFPLKIWIDRYREEMAPSRLYWNKEKKYMDFWEEKLGNEIAINISPILIEGFADELITKISRFGTPLSLETRRKYLLILSSLYGVAIKKWKWARYNPLSAVNMLRSEDREKKVPTQLPSNFIEMKNKFCALVKERMKQEGLTHRNAANKCSLTMHCLQYAINPKNNITLLNFIKICNGFNLEVSINEIKK